MKCGKCGGLVDIEKCTYCTVCRPFFTQEPIVMRNDSIWPAYVEGMCKYCKGMGQIKKFDYSGSLPCPFCGATGRAK